MTMPFSRLKVLLVCTLIASTALFAVGVAIERSHAETPETPGGEVSHTDEGAPGAEAGTHTEGGAGDEGATPAEPSTTAEHSDSDAVLLGVDLESWWLVGAVVVVSLGLALAIWFRPIRPLLVLTGVFTLVFALFDLAEVSHQVSASETGLVAIATVVALLHVSTAGFAVAAYRAPEAA
jgi:hypothetical protein